MEYRSTRRCCWFLNFGSLLSIQFFSQATGAVLASFTFTSGSTHCNKKLENSPLSPTHSSLFPREESGTNVCPSRNLNPGVQPCSQYLHHSTTTTAAQSILSQNYPEVKIWSPLYVTLQYFNFAIAEGGFLLIKIFHIGIYFTTHWSTDFCSWSAN